MKKNILSLFLVLCMCCNITGCFSSTSKYHYESAVHEIVKQNFSSAKKEIDEARKSDPNKKEYSICRGMIQIGLKNYEDAKENFNEAISNKKDDKVALQNTKCSYRGLGIASMYNGKYDEAIKYFDSALKISESSDIDIDILKYKAETYLKEGSYDEVENVCNEIKKKDKENTDIPILNGRVLVAKKEYDNAKKEFDTAISKNNMSGYYFNADLCRILNDSQNMIKNYREYMKQDSLANKGCIYGEIASYLVQKGEYKDALQVIKEGLEESNKEDTTALRYNEIATYEGMLDYNQALAKAKEYLKEYPNDENVKNEIAFLNTRI